jgi:hypothetical protein
MPSERICSEYSTPEPAEQSAAGDALQRPLRSRFRARLSASVRLLVNLVCPEKPSCTVQGAIYNESRVKQRVSSIFFRVHT